MQLDGVLYWIINTKWLDMGIYKKKKLFEKSFFVTVYNSKLDSANEVNAEIQTTSGHVFSKHLQD